jgi:hypothetical protein
MPTNNENKCPDHPEKDNLYCSECIKRIEKAARQRCIEKLKVKRDYDLKIFPESYKDCKFGYAWGISQAISALSEED